MAVPIRPLKYTDNASILDAIRADASLDYQQRIPAATEASVAETVANLYRYKPHWNEFIDALVNRIGLVVARNISWTNPLAEFKRGMLEYGDTIEEVQVGLIEAHVYDPDREYLERDIFGTTRPEVQSNFHSVNRMNYYPITVNENLLKRAFLNDGGLNSFINQLLQAPSTSDQWDEFLLTTKLFSEYESNGGFRHVHVPEVSRIGSSEADAKVALRKMRAMAQELTFLSTKYNAARMPTFAKADELVLFVTPEYNAAIDVEALAGAFNVDKTTMQGRIIPVPRDNFAINGVEAVLTVKDFFVIADTLMEMTSQRNPVSLSTNYFLHHQQIISASRFVPAVMFWNGADDVDTIVVQSVDSVSAITIEDVDGMDVTNVERGGMIALLASTVLDPEGEGAVAWSVEGAQSSKTYITQTGVLHVGGDEAASSLTVRATSTYVDPANPRLDPLSVTLAVPVVGGQTQNWPTSGKIAGIEIAGEPVAGVAPGTTTYSLSLPADTKVTKSNVNVASYGPVDADVSVSAVAGGYTVTVTVDPGTGAAVVYTVNVTVG